MSDFPTSLPTATTPDPMDAPPVRWGVLGPGRIARSFASAVRAHTRGTITAVGSRSPQRAEAFTAEHGGRPTDYDGVLDADDVDVVYVATPHSEHAALAVRALDAGKPVLVEKAFTAGAAEAAAVIETANHSGLTCMEAMWTRFLPHMDVARTLVRDGVLGDVETLLADHGQWFAEDREDRLYAPELAGGAILDLGVYPIAFAVDMLGVPTDVTARGTSAFTGVDRQVSMILTGFDDAPQAHALLSTTLAARTPTTASVSGADARLEIGTRFYGPSTLRLVHRDGRVVQGRPEAVEGGLAYEAAHMARLVTDGEPQSPLMPLAETLAIMTLMDGVRSRVMGLVD